MSAAEQTQRSHYLSSSKTEDYEAFPSEGVLEGEPNPRVHWLRNTSSGQGMLLAAMMRIEPSRIAYTFPGDETFLLTKGELDIELETGETVSVQAGDIASFPKGMKSVWVIKSPMEKFAIVTSDPA